MHRELVRLVGAIALAGATATSAMAQGTGTVTGTVTAASTGEPLSGAQVFVPGTQLGVLSGQNGRFLILNVPTGEHTIQVQLLGYTTQSRSARVTAGGTAAVDFAMESEAVQVQGVVVTALGVKREERSLGYAVQGVTDKLLQVSPQVNLVQALQGQTAGVQVVQASGRPGASSRITIRGESSFTGGGQPLFIIDGVPVSTDLDQAAGLSPLGSGSAGNRAMDFDMENVSSVSVLRGAAATALYGSRAANGAVIIETKKGVAGAPLRFEYTSSASFDNPILGGYVTGWGAGQDGLYCNGHPANDGGWCEAGYPGSVPDLGSLRGWGPNADSLSSAVMAHEGSVQFQDARKAFYQTAKSTENSLRATGSAGQMGTYTFGLAYTDQRDITAIGRLQRLNLSANVDLNMSDFLHSTTSVQRIHTYNPWSPDSWNSIHRRLKLIPPSVDYAGDQFHDDGSAVLWGNNDPSFGWVEQNEYYESTVDRWIVSQRFAATIVPGLTLTNTWGLDTYGDYRNQHQNERPWQTANGQTSGATRQTKIGRSQINDDLILSVDNLELGDTGFRLNGIVGGNIFMSQTDRLDARGQDINIPEFYNVSNFVTQTVSADLPQKQRLIGGYAQATLDYRDWAFLTLTGRNDWSSTLPLDRNSYFYPSASLGVIFTDALNWHPTWMPYGKLRLSLTKVGNDAPPYSLTSRFFVAAPQGADNAIQQFSGPRILFPFRGQVGFEQSSQLGNPDIKPESTIEQEIGLELRLFNNRWQFDGSFYNRKSYDQIFTVPSSAASGYTSIVRNAGDLRNRGLEVSLNGSVMQAGDFAWDTRVNWTRNRNTVLSLAPGVQNITLAGYSWPNIRIQADAGYGVAYGYGWQRNCVEETSSVCFPDKPTGELLIGGEGCLDPDTHTSCYGLPIRTESQINLGNVQPEWLANWTNTFRFKSLSVSGMIDIRRGSRILNFETQYTSGRIGRSWVTQDRYTTATIDGIMVDTGQPNTVVRTKDPDFYEIMYGYDKHENQMEPGGFVKLRQVTVSYELPYAALGRFGVDGATLYVTGRNLWIHSRFSQIDPEGDLYGGGNSLGQYFWQFPAPQTKGVTMGLRAHF